MAKCINNVQGRNKKEQLLDIQRAVGRNKKEQLLDIQRGANRSYKSKLLCMDMSKIALPQLRHISPCNHQVTRYKSL